MVHAGAKVSLSETPMDSSTWPFKNWQVESVYPHNGQPDMVVNMTSTATSMTVKSNDNYSITATYVVAGG
jgi:hypothetical protein